MKKIILITCVLFNVFPALAQKGIENEISKIFNSEIKANDLKNGFLKVYSHSKNTDIEIAEGAFKNGDTVTVNHPFYTASIGKMVTATAVGILKDNNLLTFDDKISKYLSPEILKGLHVLNNVEASNDITIAQLLQHTSGLPDYFEDNTLNGSPNIISQLFKNPSKTWSPHELVEYTKVNMEPLFVPGDSYHYTDTEYVLLGLIIEEISGLKLHDFFKKFIFTPLKMNNTYLNLRSKPIAETLNMAEVFVGDQEISSYTSLSADWAGGGIVSTASNLIVFQQALFTEGIITSETLHTMQSWIPETQAMYYGYGLRKVVLNELHPSLPALEIIGHSGSTGSFLYYCPSLDTYVSGTLNQTNALKNSIVLIANILNVILKQ